MGLKNYVSGKPLECFTQRSGMVDSTGAMILRETWNLNGKTLEVTGKKNHVLAWEIFLFFMRHFLTFIQIYYEQIEVFSSRRTVYIFKFQLLKGYLTLLVHSLQPPWGVAVLKKGLGYAPVITWSLNVTEGRRKKEVPWSQTKLIRVGNPCPSLWVCTLLKKELLRFSTRWERCCAFIVMQSYIVCSKIVLL